MDEGLLGAEDEGGVEVVVVVGPLVDVAELVGCGCVLGRAVAAGVGEVVAGVGAGEGAGEAAEGVLVDCGGGGWGEEGEGEEEGEEEEEGGREGEGGHGGLGVGGWRDGVGLGKR